MTWVNDLLNHLTKIFQWWVIIMPWEKAVRVRFGKHLKVLSAGVYFKIPFFDSIYIQSDRLRVVTMPPQTIATKDKHTLTLVTCVGYSISNIEMLYRKMFAPEMTISNMVMGAVSEYIFSNDLIDCNPSKIEAYINIKLSSDDYGLKYEYFKVIGYAIVKTYRLIQDQHWTSNELNTTNKI